MSSVTKAYATQISNIQAKTGKSIDELRAMIMASGITKHTELRAMLQRDLGLGHGDANALVHYILDSDGERAAAAAGATSEDVLAGIYAGPKAGLRPIHDALMDELAALGTFEVAPKKGYVSLRRKKQFAMVGPGSNARIEVGLNDRGLTGGERLIAMPAGGMCHWKVNLTSISEVDAELIGWIRAAYEHAG
jgi:Domain of unknown function (DUF5655)/Domain of unknown function (DUF4287)